MSRFLKYTTQEEPALTVGFIAAVILGLVSKFIFLSDDDLTLLGPIAMIATSAIIRSGVFSPKSVDKIVTGEIPAPPPLQP